MKYYLLAILLISAGMQSDKLRVENSFFALLDENGTLLPLDDAVFIRGEQVNFVLSNVEKFKIADDGTSWFDLDLSITGPDDKVVLSGEHLFAESGKMVLEEGIAVSPFGSFATNESMSLGVYSFTIKIYDRLGNGSTIVSKQFTLID